MERRAYFVLGDLLACITVAVAVASLVQLMIPEGWHMVAGMAIGIITGMFVGMIGGFLFTPFFGAMEVMLPVSLSGMVSGMLIGILNSIVGLTLVEAMQGGILAGLLCLAFTYLLQALLHGEVASK